MKAHFINEKFSKESDPIQDMGIGGFMPYIEYDTEIKLILEKWQHTVIKSIKGKIIIGEFLIGTSQNVPTASFLKHTKTNMQIKADKVFFEEDYIIIQSPANHLFRLERDQKYQIKEFKEKEV